jgi:Uma2 family endonuclease
MDRMMNWVGGSESRVLIKPELKCDYPLCALVESTMTISRPKIEQINPPRSPRDTLPTMYDLPSQDPEEPGLPDEFHDLQPQLLSATLSLKHYARDQIFTGTDLNLYYDVHHPLWHKRPDWFLVVGVPRLYDGVDLRASYVIWQEGVAPFVVVELLSPGTYKEDLGSYAGSAESEEALVDRVSTDPEASSPEQEAPRREVPPGKWELYEQILRVPYYIVFSRYTNKLRFFKQVGGRYQEQQLQDGSCAIWIPELELGLGLWQGVYDGLSRYWLRWCDAAGNWIATPDERAEQERQRAERLADRLRQLGVDPDQI